MSERSGVKPYNTEAEQALLGCILIDRDIQSDIVQGLSENDFYEESHKYIIGAIKTVFTQGKPIDFVTLTDALEQDGNLDKAGGISYLTALTRVTPSAANYKHYLEIVKRDSIQRRLIDAANTIIQNTHASLNSEESVAAAEKLIYDISTRLDTSKLVSLSEVSAFQEVIAKFEAIAVNKNAFRGLMTGFTKLDDITNGLQKSDLIVLAARPGIGKTSLAMNIVENIAVTQKKVCAVFSLEMPKLQLAQRLICSQAKVDLSKALSSKLDTENDFKRLWAANEVLSKTKIFVDDSSIITPGQILSKSRRLKAMHGLDLIMIDYIQLMKSGDKKVENRQQEISEITRSLKILAKEINVPVIALSQLKRMSGEPQLTDLRESGAIEQDADIVLFIHRPYEDATEAERQSGNIDKALARIKVAKHRNGPTGIVDLKFIASSTRFVNYDYNPPDMPAPVAREEAGKLGSYAPGDMPPQPDYLPEPTDEEAAIADITIDSEVFD